MNAEAQRSAIAQACGWCYCGSDSTTAWYLPPAAAPLLLVKPEPWLEIDKRRRTLPDYLGDLNMMHEAERTLTAAQCYSFNHHLGNLLGPWTPRSGPANWPFHATAAQRAEAFLRAIEKWEVAK